MKKKIALPIVGLIAGFIFATQSLSLTLYDDFSGISIDQTKWRQREWVREIRNGRFILKQGSPNPIVITSYPYTVSHVFGFQDPRSVNSIQADVTVVESEITNSAWTRARLGGYWFKDDTPGGGMAGDIWAEVAIKDTPEGHWAYCGLTRITNPDGTTFTDVSYVNFKTPINLGDTYTLYIGYDSGSNAFLFKIGDEGITMDATVLPPRVGDAVNTWRGLLTKVDTFDSNSSSYISAAFDNVYKNGVPYDDFSSPIIDSTKWTSYELVREISENQLRINVRSDSTSSSSIENSLYFIRPTSINALQARVTLVDYQNSQGLYERVDIQGGFYNDGSPGGGRIGDVAAQVRIAGTGPSLIAEWSVIRFIDSKGEDTEYLALGQFATPIVLGTQYTLFIWWDGSQFTLKINDEVAHYTPVTPINPIHTPYKGLTTKIYPEANKKQAVLEVFYDDVMVEQVVEDISLSNPLYGSVFDCCSLSTPPIVAWTSGETFKGYEIQFSSDHSFSSIPVRMKVKLKESTSEATLPAATWKKVLTMAGASEGIAYWRVQGKRANGTTGVSEVSLLQIERAAAVENPTLSPTSKSALPVLSWQNNCNTKFKVWFGSDEGFTKKVPYSFSVKNPNEDGGIFSQGLASAQWKAVRKLVNDVSGSTIYWYVESWDGLGRYSKAETMNFNLTD